MGEAPVPSPPSLASAEEREAFGQFVEHAVRYGAMSQGHHNQNYVLPLTERIARLVGRTPGDLVTVRLRMRDALPVVIRTWQDESAILHAVRGVLPHVPECLAKCGDSAVHSYVEGVPFSSICQDGKPVDSLLINALSTLLAQMTQVRREALPGLPDGWARANTGGQSFLRTLVHLAERQIRRPNWGEFGGLFKALGIPEDALMRLAERVPRMARRPYSLLHTDLHRDNVIFAYDGDPPLICVDWELATYGDPLHDLATHLVRMRYPDNQWEEVIGAWADAMERFRPRAVNGLTEDLKHYVAFERAQSVYPDVMRAARSLGDSPDQRSLDEATRTVRTALENAAVPLRLPDVPEDEEILHSLFRWRVGSRKPYQASRQATSIGWVPNRRVPEHPDFPPSAVLEALAQEGAAPASRVFKGTAHLNTVVRVGPSDLPVVVRRKLSSAGHRERRILSEHAVLRAIEESGLPVRAPRVLALGTSGFNNQFAIHSYEGPGDGDLLPVHPVDGLQPIEADQLVDQLVALARVDSRQLDPTAPVFDFYHHLCAELVRLVLNLPRKSRNLAREFGLPDGDRLRGILGRHQLSPRRSSLLHGDLNPWNLVRDNESWGGGLIVIDWEMAMVGDPLYDLVRHIHLTPTSTDIRQRMFARWTSCLPRDCTVGWKEDWRVYRWIEIVRSAYVDLDRLVTGTSLDAPNVRRAVDSYAMTLESALAALGLPSRPASNPYLARALPRGGQAGFSFGLIPSAS